MVGTDLAARRARHQTVRVQDYWWCACQGRVDAVDCDAAVAFAALEAAEAAARVAEQHMAAWQAESAHLQAVIRDNWTPRAEQAEARVQAAVEAFQAVLPRVAWCPCDCCLQVAPLIVRALQQLQGPADA